MVFGRSGGFRGEGMDHTKRFPRTLAGFGLTWHGGSRFSCFLEILETHFITKYLQIGPRASRLVLGFLLKARVPSQELSNKCIVQKMTWRKTIFSGKLDNLPKSSVFVRMASFFMPCFWPHGARGHKGQMQRIPKTN